ncbi:Protein-serine/threonine phosphatase [Entamoeba marina]
MSTALNPQKSLNRFKTALSQYFQKYLYEINTSDDAINLSLPISLFLSGISYDVYSSTETSKAKKDGVFRYINNINIQSKYQTKHSLPKVSALSFVQNTPLQSLQVMNISSIFDWEEVICKQLTSLTVKESTFILTDLQTFWPSLKHLSIIQSNIKEIPPNIFTQNNFPQLNTLNLSNNMLSVLENIGDRPFDVLNVSHNKITDIIIPIPGSISELNLSHNQLTTLDKISAFFSLRSLDVSNNRLVLNQTTSGVFNKMYSLTQLQFHHNPTEGYRNILLKELPAIEFGLKVVIDDDEVNKTEQEITQEYYQTNARPSFVIEKDEEHFTEQMLSINSNEPQHFEIQTDEDLQNVINDAKREMRSVGSSTIVMGKGNIHINVGCNEEDAEEMAQQIFQIVQKITTVTQVGNDMVEVSPVIVNKYDIATSDISDKASVNELDQSLDTTSENNEVMNDSSQIPNEVQETKFQSLDSNLSNIVCGEDTSSDSVSELNSNELVE